MINERWLIPALFIKTSTLPKNKSAFSTCFGAESKSFISKGSISILAPP